MGRWEVVVAAAWTLSVLGLAGCGSSNDTTVIEAPASESPDVSEQFENYDAEMEKSMSQPGG